MDELPSIHNHLPPGWSLLTGDLGRFSVYGSVALFAVSALAWYFAKKNPRLEKVGAWTFVLACMGIGATFLSLAILFVGNRFEYEYVWGHSDLANTVPYRIAGIWSGQEGSFLLWALCAAVFGVVVATGAGIYRRWFTIVYALFLGAVTAILAYESPFKMILANGQPTTPVDGVGLSPALQNYWVIIHPPTIFLGFGSLTALFAMAVAAMVVRNYTDWTAIVRPWAIVSLTLVGVGLCMGGFWAYETLGWGGFWMWDPVENTSFVPWCITAALVHGIIVQGTRKKWHFSNLMMAGLPFITFVYGTFLTRSGFLSDASVHSFAEMDRSALKLLIGVMAASTLGFLILWIARLVKDAKSLASDEVVKGLHREGFYRTGSLLLMGMGVATMIGMSVPMFMALAGKPAKVVEERLYHLVLPWIFIPLIIVMAIAPFASWKGEKNKDLAKKVYSVLCVTIGLTGFLMMAIALSPMSKIADLRQPIGFPGGFQINNLPWVMFLTGLCVFTIVANVWRMVEVSNAKKIGWSPFVTHVGVAVLLAGLIISRGFERHEQAMVMENHPDGMMNYQIRYAGMTSDTSDRDNEVKFEIVDPHDDNRVLYTATPGFYYAKGGDGSESPMVWPHIQRFAMHDVYFALQPPQSQVSEPLTLKPGETKMVGGMKIKFLKMTQEGEPGMPGTKFGAMVEIDDQNSKRTLTPKMEVGGGEGVGQIPAKIDGTMNIAMTSMNVADKSVTLQVQLASPMYLIDIFHKPMTSLVWLGTGMMTFGGFLAAFYRRRVRKTVAERGKQTEPDSIPSARESLVTT